MSDICDIKDIESRIVSEIRLENIRYVWFECINKSHGAIVLLIGHVLILYFMALGKAFHKITQLLYHTLSTDCLHQSYGSFLSYGSSPQLTQVVTRKEVPANSYQSQLNGNN